MEHFAGIDVSSVWIVSRWISRAMPVPILSFLVAQAAVVNVTNGCITS